jgi:hypothetical protein
MPPQADARKQLAGFIEKFDPALARDAKAILAKMRRCLPGATELVYDNYNALAIAFGPGPKPRNIIFSIALYPRWISLFFADGKSLRDPKKLLRGSGARIRHIVLETPGVLDSPDVRALMAQALEKTATLIDPAAPRRLVIQAISPRQRPRRPVR